MTKSSTYTAKILLVEDERPIREMLKYSLEKQSYEVMQAANGPEAREIMLSNRPDLIILDWMMPGESGIDVLKYIRSDNVLADIPVLMLTARSEEADKVSGLDGGADDYMTKPVAIKEFLARIKALLRRTIKSSENQVLEIDGIQLNLATHQLTIDDTPVNIVKTEFNLLKFFMTHKNKIYTRSQLLDFVWGQTVYVGERTVDVHVLRLRKLLKPFNKSDRLVTVRGSGYLFKDDGSH